jgi:ketosteroid isomerase-like protein
MAQLKTRSEVEADEVHQASDRFYAALNRVLQGDAGPMLDVWSHTSDVTTMHPIGEREVGWEQVEGPWQQVASMSSGGQVAIKDPLIWVVGDLAYEVGTEAGSATIAGEAVSFGHRVTNIYRREDGVWKTVHHHADKSPAMEEIVSRLQR